MPALAPPILTPPIRVGVPPFTALGSGFRNVTDDVIGEQGLRIMLAEWTLAARAEKGAAGWGGETQKAIATLKRKIAESERCIAAHERRTKRPVATDRQSLASVSWSSWNARGVSWR